MKSFTHIFTAFLFCLLSLWGHATHIVGGVINYECLGGQLYKIKLTMYRDCYNGVPNYDDPAAVGVFDINNNLVQTIFIPGPAVQPPPMDPVISSPCLIPPADICYQEYTYTATVNLPYLPGGYQLAYQRCCRNWTINNMVNPSEAGETYYANIPDQIAFPCNSNPVFTNKPPQFICVNEPLTFDYSATDKDGDSLVYEICAPFDGASQNNPKPQPPFNPPYKPINFSPPFNLGNIMGGVPLTVDPRTGIISAEPAFLGQFVYALCVYEYRNGVLLDYTKMDFQFNVVDCERIVEAAITDPKALCDGKTALFENKSRGATGYEWDFGDPTTNQDKSTLENPIYTYPDTGKYLVTLVAKSSQNRHCQDTTRVWVNVVEGPKPDFSADTACIGSPVHFTDLSASNSGYNRSWTWKVEDTTMLIQNPEYAFKTSGFHDVSLTVTSSYGCKNTVTKRVFVYPPPQITSSPDELICPGESVQLNASGGETYQWAPAASLSDPNISDPVASPSATTSYRVTATDANGCSNVDTTVIEIKEFPRSPAGPDQFLCEGASANLQATGGISYQWSPAGSLDNPNSSSPTASPGSTTPYFVTITDELGCTMIDTVIVNVIQPPTANAGNDKTICFGDSIPLNGSGGSFYAWSPENSFNNHTSKTPVAFPKFTTTYTLTVTDIYGCSGTDKVVINVNPPPDVSTSPDQTICYGDSATVSANGAVSYVWLPGNSVLNPTSPTTVVTPKETTTYTVIGTDDKGCTSTKKIVITVNGLPNAVTTPDPEICVGESIQLNATGGTNFTWTPATGLSDPNIGNPVANPLTTTTYIVNVSDNFGCASSDTVVVKVNSLPLMDAGPDKEICYGDSVRLTGSGGLSYEWTPSEVINDPTLKTIKAGPLETTTFTLTVTDSNGCRNTDEAIVTVHPLPVADAGPNVTICKGGSTVLNPSGGVGYSWSPAERLSNPNDRNPIAYPQNTTTYQVTVTDRFGCTNIDSMIVFHFSPEYEPEFEVCLGGETELSVPVQDNNYTYEWIPATGLSDPYISNPVLTPEEPGLQTYLVIIKTNECEPETATVRVNVTLEPILSTPEKITIREGQKVELIATGAKEYEWFPKEGLSDPYSSPTYVRPSKSTTYLVYGTDENGCMDIDSIFVHVLGPCRNDDIFVPNAFTPNADGNNDVLYAYGIGFDAITMRIYNRWGEKVFEANSFEEGWDGTYKGIPLNPGVYDYYVQARCPNRVNIFKKGNITIIR